jgi:hypothetical protein
LWLLRLFAGSAVDPDPALFARRGIICQNVVEATLGLDLVLQRRMVAHFR